MNYLIDLEIILVEFTAPCFNLNLKILAPFLLYLRILDCENIKLCLNLWFQFKSNTPGIRIDLNL